MDFALVWLKSVVVCAKSQLLSWGVTTRISNLLGGKVQALISRQSQAEGSVHSQLDKSTLVNPTWAVQPGFGQSLQSREDQAGQATTEQCDAASSGLTGSSVGNQTGAFHWGDASGSATDS